MQSRISTGNNPQLHSCQGRSPFPSRRRAVAATELAIVLPLLMTILLGATDFGRFSHSRIAIINAARCGAGYASMNPYDSSSDAAWKAGVKLAVTNELSQSPAFDPAKLTVNSTNMDEANGLRRVTVSVAYPFETLVNWPLVPSTLNLQQTVVMRGIR